MPKEKLYAFFTLLFLLQSVFLGYSLPKARRGEQTNENAHNAPPENEGSPLPPEALTLPLNPKVKETRLILFKSYEAKEAFEQNNAVNVIHEYNTIPILLVRASKEEIKKIQKHPSTIGTFYNQEVPLPSLPPRIGKEGNESLHIHSQESYKAIGANYMWEEGYKGSGEKIAIIDTGVYHHPEFEGRIADDKSFVKEKYGYSKNLGPTEDLDFHGTAVAGVAAGSGINDKGQGVAPKATILNARVFPKEGSATLAGILAAIEWAVQKEADVINLSLGTSSPVWYDDPIVAAVNEVMREGITVVASAGNAGDQGLRSMSVGSPGCAEEIITVTAVDYDGSGPIEYYSSIGPSIHANLKPDIAAPSNVYSTTLNDEYTTGRLRGTSFSAPHVAGAAALFTEYLKERGISKGSPGIIKSTFMKTADPVLDGKKRFDEIYAGTGCINLTSAYEYLKPTGEWPETLSITPSHIPMGLTNKSSNFYPYPNKLFQGQMLAFNFTVASSYNTTIAVSYSGNVTAALDVHSASSFNVTAPTTLWQFNTTVNHVEEGFYHGIVNFTDGEKFVAVPIEFYLQIPEARLLWDMKHTSWMVDFPYGQYRNFYLQVTNLNVSVEIWYYQSGKDPTNVLNPSEYEIVYAPDSASSYPLYHPNGTIKATGTTSFTSQEVEAFQNYVQEGGTVVITTLGDESKNFTALNQLTGNFGITYEGTFSPDFTASASITDQAATHLLTMKVKTLAYQGCDMTLAKGVLLVAEYREGGDHVIALNETDGGGEFIAMSTNFMFDNWNYAGRYPSGTKKSTKEFIKNIVKLACARKKPLPPEVAIESPEDGEITGKNVTIRWDGGGVGKGIKYFSVARDDRDWINVNRNLSHTFRGLEAGNHTVEIKAVDFYGNETTTDVTFTVDATSPSLTILTPTDGATVSKEVNVSWTASDEHGIHHFEIRIDNGNWTRLSSYTSKYELTDLETGNHTVEIKAVDPYGNTVEKQVSFTVKEEKQDLRFILVGIGVGVVTFTAITAYLRIKKRKS